MVRYHYSGFKTREHPRGDFRTHKPYVGTVQGSVRTGFLWGWIQVCEQWMAGRWESFVIVRGKAYPTKAEALKHRPPWDSAQRLKKRRGIF